jgi:fructose-1,6-bisphosphatase/inositol monophosphatase family enzyme
LILATGVLLWSHLKGEQAGSKILRKGRGRLDAFWEMELAPWDTIAGALIAREAGARTTRLDGSEIRGAATEVLAAPSELHAEVLEVLYRARS